MSESYAIRCPACGEWQSCLVTTLVEYVFSCRREDCGKRRLMKHVNEAGLQANCQGPYRVTEVGRVVAELNAKGQIRDFAIPRTPITVERVL